MGWHYPEYDPRVDGIGHEDYRPDPSEFAEEEFERKRKRDYPRGYGPPDNDENGPDPDLESLEESDDPERFLHPGDFTSSPSAEPWDTPIYHVRTPGADYPDETDPAEWEDREEERAHENLRGHFGSTPIGGILTQAEQWPDRVAANRHAADHADCESEGFHHYYRGGECEDCGKPQPNWDGATDAKSPNEYFFQKHHGSYEDEDDTYCWNWLL